MAKTSKIEFQKKKKRRKKTPSAKKLVSDSIGPEISCIGPLNLDNPDGLKKHRYFADNSQTVPTVTAAIHRHGTQFWDKWPQTRRDKRAEVVTRATVRRVFVFPQPTKRWFCFRNSYFSNDMDHGSSI
jgi:hypothetical protein